MSQKRFLLIMFFICIFFLTLVQLSAQEEGEIIIISGRVGKEIDQEERDKFKLFEGIKGFQSAVYIKLPDNRYFLKITYLVEKTGELKIKRIQQSEESVKKCGDYIDHYEEIQEQKKYVYSNPGASIYFELFGKLFYSLNVDYRINKSEALSLGISAFEDAIFPSIMYYKFKGEKYRRETGIGLGPLFTQTEGWAAGIVIYGVIGYRYQQKNGLLFRIGFTPFLMIGGGVFLPLPSAGISVGYSF